MCRHTVIVVVAGVRYYPGGRPVARRAALTCPKRLTMTMISRNMAYRISTAFDTRDLLGEGPVWDGRTGSLTWVDIRRRLVAGWRPGSAERAEAAFPEEVSLCVPCVGRGSVVAQVDRLIVGEGDAWSVLCAVDGSNPHTRLNDGGCDAAGRLWVGTYSTRGEPEAALYCVTSDGEATAAIDGLTASNGIGWNPDGTVLYLADTGRCRVDAYAMDPHGGRTVTHVGTVFEDDGSRGRPDGLAVDRDGAIWVAMWGGGHLRRYAPDGRLLTVVPTPVTFPTSVAFGGTGLETLYITTSSHHLEDPDGEPFAGSLLQLTPPVPGLATGRFAR
jgi:sugar lactone lactonase YvrE